MPNNTKPLDTAPKNKKLLLPIMVSILIHVIVICGLFFWQKKETTQNQRVETALVSPEELGEIQQQINQSQAANNTSSSQNLDYQQHQTTQKNIESGEYKPYQPIPPEAYTETIERNLTPDTNTREESIFTSSSETADDFTINDEIIDEYQQSSGIDPEIEQSEQEQTTVNNKSITTEQNTSDDTTSSNKENNAITQNSNKQTNNATKSNSISNTASINNNTGLSSNNTLSAIKAKVSSYLPNANEILNAGSDATLLTLTVDTNGYITNHTATGKNKQLNDASVEAAYKAQPLPINVNNPKTYPTITIQLKGKSLN